MPPRRRWCSLCSILRTTWTGCHRRRWPILAWNRKYRCPSDRLTLRPSGILGSRPSWSSNGRSHTRRGAAPDTPKGIGWRGRPGPDRATSPSIVIAGQRRLRVSTFGGYFERMFAEHIYPAFTKARASPYSRSSRVRARSFCFSWPPPTRPASPRWMCAARLRSTYCAAGHNPCGGTWIPRGFLGPRACARSS